MPKNKRSTSWDRLSLFVSICYFRQKYTLTQYLSLTFPYWLSSWMQLLTLVLSRIYFNRNSFRHHSSWNTRIYRSTVKRKDMDTTRKWFSEQVESVTSVSSIQMLLTIELRRYLQICPVFFSSHVTRSILEFQRLEGIQVSYPVLRYPSVASTFDKLFAVIIIVSFLIRFCVSDLTISLSWNIFESDPILSIFWNLPVHLNVLLYQAFLKHNIYIDFIYIDFIYDGSYTNFLYRHWSKISLSKNSSLPKSILSLCVCTSPVPLENLLIISATLPDHK